MRRLLGEAAVSLWQALCWRCVNDAAGYQLEEPKAAEEEQMRWVCANGVEMMLQAAWSLLPTADL